MSLKYATYPTIANTLKLIDAKKRLSKCI